MNNDAREAIADAIIQGRFRYAARLLFLWANVTTRADENKIQDDVESYSQYPVVWEWARNMHTITIKHKGEVFSYTKASCSEERWFTE